MKPQQQILSLEDCAKSIKHDAWKMRRGMLESYETSS